MIYDGLKLNILGTEYKLVYKSEEEYDKLRATSSDGMCEAFAKKIVVEKLNRDDKFNYENIDAYEEKVLRHEIVHAFLFESGLSDYVNDEAIVDWMAIQIPKIVKVFMETQAMK